jgi:hypothetical protein
MTMAGVFLASQQADQALAGARTCARQGSAHG